MIRALASGTSSARTSPIEASRAIAAAVTRWGGALPQYAVGHLDRVRRVRAAVAGLPGLAVAGAAYDGVGVPACAASGRRAGALVAEALPAAAPPVAGAQWEA